MLGQYAALGWRVAIVTKQGGVACGYQREAQAAAVHLAVLDALPMAADASLLCPHLPERTHATFAVDCPNRKPAAGAILTALGRFGARARDCLFVGDQEADRVAAEADGVPFVWASEFFGWAE